MQCDEVNRKSSKWLGHVERLREQRLGRRVYLFVYECVGSRWLNGVKNACNASRCRRTS